jgi:hypothetical protein
VALTGDKRNPFFQGLFVNFFIGVVWAHLKEGKHNAKAGNGNFSIISRGEKEQEPGFTSAGNS